MIASYSFELEQAADQNSATSFWGFMERCTKSECNSRLESGEKQNRDASQTSIKLDDSAEDEKENSVAVTQETLKDNEHSSAH